MLPRSVPLLEVLHSMILPEYRKFVSTRECDIDGIDGHIDDDAVFDDDVNDVSHRDQIEDPHPNRDQKSVLWCFGEAR
jgi:hypothetical protein